MQKIADYRLHLAAARDYLAIHGTPETKADLRAHRMVGYIPDMIFDRELDYLAQLGGRPSRARLERHPVQLQWLRAGAGLGMVHAFVLPFAPELVPVMPDVTLTRALLAHPPRRRYPLDRLDRFAETLIDGLRAEVARLESYVVQEG